MTEHSYTSEASQKLFEDLEPDDKISLVLAYFRIKERQPGILPTWTMVDEELEKLYREEWGTKYQNSEQLRAKELEREEQEEFYRSILDKGPIERDENEESDEYKEAEKKMAKCVINVIEELVKDRNECQKAAEEYHRQYSDLRGENITRLIKNDTEFRSLFKAY
ncbi:hypothetical protein HYFRA_00013665 [Hymenoscyphus fraxineus]|uniref:Uncharacterized protein n=1 Tax=Hymenoscyphus fraxineus TaxID=746836 RepID=A0A9N9PZW9_9HELO|nr:hypothetical protein HYFRA_00013665 [Hymenoscyphus fraxineus]